MVLITVPNGEAAWQMNSAWIGGGSREMAVPGKGSRTWEMNRSKVVVSQGQALPMATFISRGSGDIPGLTLPERVGGDIPFTEAGKGLCQVRFSALWYDIRFIRR